MDMGELRFVAGTTPIAATIINKKNITQKL